MPDFDVLGKGIESAKIQPNVAFSTYMPSQVIGRDPVEVTLSSPDSNFLRASSSVTAGLVAPKTLALDNAAQSAIAKLPAPVAAVAMAGRVCVCAGLAIHAARLGALPFSF